MASVRDFLHERLALLLRALWFSVSTYLFPLFVSSRFRRNVGPLKINSETIFEESSKEGLKVTEPNTKLEENQEFFDFSGCKDDGFRERESPKFSFTFKFPTYEEFCRSKRDVGNFVTLQDIPSAKLSTDDEPKVDNFNVNEVNQHSDGGPAPNNDIKEEMEEEEEETQATVHEETPDSASKNDVQDYASVESDPEPMPSSNAFHSVTGHLVDSYADGFLSDGDFGGNLEDNPQSDSFSEEDSDIMGELRDLEEEIGLKKSDFLSDDDFHEEKKPESCNITEKNSSVMDSNKLESLWEHQELIEQLKMELKKVRATGLPTILEESESPKIMEDLKPWKIEESFHRGDRMNELHKFYKSYRERMRKFDILNYQKMYAIGFLQLKDPLQSNSAQKSSIPEITSFLSQSFAMCKGKKLENDPTMKFVKELQSDLEVVYVGQMCLSWEILHWQYEKALDLWESDPRGIRRFNEVAGEFQQFQVLVERFIEDEPFQGPRIQNYVKSRCVLRNLLQVPVIREDSSKNRRKAKRGEGGEYDISSDLLVEILEESIRIFWRFVRADKDRKAVPVQIQDPADSPLFTEVQKDLQKKERKLKEVLRSENCILRRFQKCKEDESSSTDQVLYFFSQVDMKLVSRVLHMSRITTDQLIWCRNKLSKVSFVNRKIHVQPTFLLFPC